MKKFILIITLLFCFPTFISASSCSGVEWEVLQEMANNVTVTLEEVTDENGNISFSATFAGVSHELRIYNATTVINYFPSVSEGFGEVRIDSLELGKTYSFRIQGLKSCFTKNFKTVTLNIPNYNPYYSDPLCDKARGYSMCQKWNKVDVSYDEFVNSVSKYIQENKTTVTPDYNEYQENTFFAFYQKYYWFCMGGLIIFLTLLVFLWIKQNNKNKL